MSPPDPGQIDISQLHQSLGAIFDDAKTTFSIWAPTIQNVKVLLDDDRAIELEKLNSGFHVGCVEDVLPGSKYQYQLDDGAIVPDPASRFQHESVHGPSLVVDSRFEWTDEDWQPPLVDDWVIYELHIGTWTDAGTFESAIDRLDELVQLGVNAIELMPVADCAGRWNWGYDGVHLFAPNRNYGSPDQLRRLIDASHAKGLAIILDVVYNHLGPEGNYLGTVGPYLSEKHHTVWGSAPNFDDPIHGDQCRRFFIANAMYWMDEFHFDGIRVDAIHCMRDERRPHVAVELSDATALLQRRTGRASVLIAESNIYDPTMVVPTKDGGVGFDAQWSDDFIHSLYACVRNGEQLSDRHYNAGTDLKQVLDKGYIYLGTFDKFRCRENPDQRINTNRMIRCIQNHDFIGNHPSGKRITAITDQQTHAAMAALMMLSPAIPMLFMGEEFACENPFAFFVDFADEELRTGVIQGRQREYPQHDWSSGVLPIDRAAMTGSKIGEITNRTMWSWYQSLIELRRNQLCSNDQVKKQYLSRASNEENRFAIQYEKICIEIGLKRFGDDQQPATAPEDFKEILLDSRVEFPYVQGDSWAIIYATGELPKMR